MTMNLKINKDDSTHTKRNIVLCNINQILQLAHTNKLNRVAYLKTEITEYGQNNFEGKTRQHPLL